MQVTPDGYESQVKSHVPHRGVRLKDGNHSQLHEHEEHRMIPESKTVVERSLAHSIAESWRASGGKRALLEFDGQGDGVEEDVDLEDEEEEEPKVFEHLRKEIPEEADVGGQVWDRETGGEGKRKTSLKPAKKVEGRRRDVQLA